MWKSSVAVALCLAAPASAQFFLNRESRFEQFEQQPSRPLPSIFSVFDILRGGDDDAGSPFFPESRAEPTSSQPIFDIFFSDDSVAVLNFAPPPPPAPKFTLFFDSGPSSFLRGSFSSEVEEVKPKAAEHPCMSCASDLEKLCPAELNNESEDSLATSFHRQMCLMRQFSDLSAGCATTMDSVEDNLVATCFKDIDAFCSDVSPGNSQVHGCLAEHHCDLSPSCQAHVEQAAARLPGAAGEGEGSMFRPEAPAPPMLAENGLVESFFDLVDLVLGGGKSSADAEELEPEVVEEPVVGRGPETWAPVEPEEEPEEEPVQEAAEEAAKEEGSLVDTFLAGLPVIGGQSLGWSPSSSSNMKLRMPPLEMMEKGPKVMRQPALGSDPITWKPRENGGSTEQEQEPPAVAVEDPEDGEEERPLIGSDPHTWTPRANENQKRKEAAVVAVSSPEVTEGSAEEAETSAAQLMRLGFVAAGAAGLLVLAAVSSHASRARSQRRAHDEWRRSFAPSLLG